VRNTFIIFLVSGFWHGASWNFIAWGFLHACGFIPLLLLDRNRKHVSDIVAHDRSLPTWKEAMGMTSTFAFVCLAWVFFRAEDLGQAFSYIRQLVSSLVGHPAQFLQVPEGKGALAFIALLLAGDWYLRRDERRLRFTAWMMIPIAITSLLFLIKSFGKNVSFIYFQF
jgi:hypothetical protein